MTQETGTGRRVVIIGGSFAGLGAAYAVRERSQPSDQITLISQSEHFVFAPSLVWAALGKPLLNSSFNLGTALAAKDIRFVRSTVHEVRVEDHVVGTDAGEFPYDRLLIATGGRPDTARIQGLAGEFRAASWVVGESSALEARNTIRELQRQPGPVVVGASQDASYISAAYEIVLSLDALLRRTGVRDRAPLSFVTAEPYLGHLGLGQTAARPQLERLFTERNITPHVGAEIVNVRQDGIQITTDGYIPASTNIIMPPFTGAIAIWKSAGLTDETGMIPVTPEYRHVDHPDIYAAGVASYFQDRVPPLLERHAPHTGYLSLHMGQTAGQHLAASLGAGPAPGRPLPSLLDIRVIDGGNVGLLLTSRGTEKLANRAVRLPGRTSRYLKATLERYLLWRLRTGRMNLP